MGKEGWTFDEDAGVIPDPVLGARRLYEIYLRSDPTYTGRLRAGLVATVDAIQFRRAAELADLLVGNPHFEAGGTVEIRCHERDATLKDHQKQPTWRANGKP